MPICLIFHIIGVCKLSLLYPWRHSLSLLLVAFCIVLTPYLYLYRALGQTPVMPTGAFNVADYYYERMEEVDDGHTFLGNPYFIEHKDDMPPAFFLADWFAAISLVLGMSLMNTALLDFFIWSYIFLLLVYSLFRVLDLPGRWSFAGSVIAFLSVYMHMIRPVSMQVIYPFFLLFLIAFVLWLKEPTSRRRIYFAALSAAMTAYIYTYAWQIVIVVLILTPLAFWLTNRREYLRSFLRMFGIFVLASLPLMLFTWIQVHTPFYFETIERIGLVNTHLPASAVVSSCIWIPAMFLLWYILSRVNTAVTLKEQQGAVFLFFVLTGTAMVAVTLSNIITGKDLELPQHIERFTILWLSFASVYSLYFFANKATSHKLTHGYFFAGILLVGLIFYGNVRYLITYGPVDAFAPVDKVSEINIQELAKPLAWLNENVKDQSVIWADPNGQINRYITMMTKHYVLFYAGGPLHILSNKESEERYLTAHYFSLSEIDLENDYWAYGGVGNAVHQWKTHNREVKVCRMLHLDRLGHECGELTDRVSWKGKFYFEELYAKYQNDVQPNIIEKLRKYHVVYIIRDNETDSPTFQPELIPGTSLVYSDGRFFIYSLK